MRWVTGAALLLVVTFLAGCADGGGAAEPQATEDFGVAPTEDAGIVIGVVVDDAIRPLVGATVILRIPDAPRTATTDDDGRFAFADVPPGTYFLEATHPQAESAQTSVEVVAGDPDPPVVRLQLTRLFSQEPFHEAIKFTGFIQCGYVAVVISSLCVNDYTTLVINGGCCPELRELVDNRGYVSEVGSGWQTMVFELTWEPSAQGTSEEMFVLVSYTNRTASDWYGQVGGASPVLLRFEQGVQHPTGAGEPPLIPEEGLPNLYTFAGIDGDDVAIGFSQEFEIFQHNFYYGKPPEGWSFVAGDAPPF